MYLSDVSYFKLLFLKREILEKIVFVKNKMPKSVVDYGIVFGGPSMIPNRVDEAIRLYKEGMINKIVLTGGIGYFSQDKKNPEAYLMYEYLYNKRIPDEDIIVEYESKSTYDNIHNVVNKLKDINNKKVLLITSDFHLNRCMRLMKRNIKKKSNIYGVGIKDNKIDLDTWDISIKGRFVILKEVMLLRHYIKKEFIEDISF